MSDESSKVWQTRIWIGEEVDQPATVYGESLIKLKSAVADWLRENKPLAFGNAPPGFELSRRWNYSYSDGSKINPFGGGPLGKEKVFEEGWHYVGGSPTRWPSKFQSFNEVIKHFVTQAMIPEKGPGFKDIPLTESDFPIHLMKTVKREESELHVNDMLQRGWYIISLDYKPEARDMSYVGRTTIFVLGHPEDNAF